jgi:hypothetical protein
VEILYTALLIVAAFWLGACPFSLWVGKWLLGKDIRNYGDVNPGASNVLRAGVRGLPHLEIFFAVVIFMIFWFLLIDVDGWRVMFATTSTFIYLLAEKGVSLEPLFMLCVIAILLVKHFDDLKAMPRFKGRLITWIQARKTANAGHR